MNAPRRSMLRLSVTVVGFALVVGHGGPELGCGCGSPCAEPEDQYYDVEGCWFDGLAVRFPPCTVNATFYPGGQETMGGSRNDPYSNVALVVGQVPWDRIRCEALAPDSDRDSRPTEIVCTDRCPTPGDDLSCTGTLRLRDTPLGEPPGSAEFSECSYVDGFMPDLALDASPPAVSDAAMEGAMDADAPTDAGADDVDAH